nr:MAG TPA: hypothetical protein [Caudoviricetes sp.]
MLHFRQLTQERQTFWRPGSSTGPGFLLAFSCVNCCEFSDILTRAHNVQCVQRVRTGFDTLALVA